MALEGNLGKGGKGREPEKIVYFYSVAAVVLISLMVMRTA